MSILRPLAEIVDPYLDRHGLEAAIWRVTGTRNPGVVNQLLNVADIYAASQGPKLADEVARRREERGRFDRMVTLQLASARNNGMSSPVARIRPERKYAQVATETSSNPRAAPVWEEDNVMYQQCTKCGAGKPYEQFHRDKGRWNGRASQCKPCKLGKTA